MRLFKPFNKKFVGHWDERIGYLFDLDVDFEGKRIVDAGCNMGIIGYELCKRRPAFFHGLDVHAQAIGVARKVFTGVETPSRFDVIDLSDTKRLAARLEGQYDIGILLSTWHHVRKVRQEKADAMAALIATRCRESVIARVPPELADTFGGIVAALGFRETRKSAGGGGKLTSVFIRYDRDLSAA